MVVNPSFWQGKKVFVTGHTGFKGGWLSLWLQKMGAEVVGFSLPPTTSPSLFESANVDTNMKSIMGDIRNIENLISTIKESEPEIVFHLAAQALVRHSYQHPVETFSTNIMGTIHVLEALRDTPSVRAAVLITSDKCYENKEWIWGYRENDPMGGHDPYSSSKGCSELIISSYRRSFFEDTPDKPLIASARAGNVIGGGDWAQDRLIPDIVRGFLNGEPCLIRNPSAVRPWQHVLEPLKGYLMLVEHLYRGENSFASGWNFGPNDADAKTVFWIADYLKGHWGGKADWYTESAEQPHEAQMLSLDCSKARYILNWQPSITLTDALETIVEWYRCYQAGDNMQKVTINQINWYERSIQAKNEDKS